MKVTIKEPVVEYKRLSMYHTPTKLGDSFVWEKEEGGIVYLGNKKYVVFPKDGTPFLVDEMCVQGNLRPAKLVEVIFE